MLQNPPLLEAETNAFYARHRVSLRAPFVYRAARYFRTGARDARTVNRGLQATVGNGKGRGKHFEPFARDDSITTGLEMGHAAQTLNAAWVD